MIWYVKRDDSLMHSATSDTKAQLEATMLDPLVSMRDFKNSVKQYEKLYGLRVLQKFINDNGLNESYNTIYDEKFLKNHAPSDAIRGIHAENRKRIGSR